MLERFIVNKDIKNSNKTIIFDAITNKFYNIDIHLGKLINKIQEDPNILSMNPELNDKINNFISTIDENDVIMIPEKMNYKKLNQVRIHVANKCNMACKYCYASGGTYGKEEGIMSTKKSKDVAKMLIKSYELIKEINFFGGEPFLNINAIEIICSEFLSEYNNKKIDYLPRFTVVTNGTILNNELINLINEYKIKIMVSLDSSIEEINDYCRIFRDGKGSFNIIDNNIKTMRKFTGEPSIIEATYTKLHYDNDISYLDIMKSNYERYGIKRNIIVKVSYTNNALVDYDENIYFNNININNIDGNTFEKRILLFLSDGLIDVKLIEFLAGLNTKKYYLNFCNAGIGQIAIDINGNIYPCQMFVDVNLSNKDFCMGNVNQGISKEYLEIIDELESINKSIEQCDNCNYKLTCRECLFDMNNNGLENTFKKCYENELRYAQSYRSLVKIIEKEENLKILLNQIKNLYKII